MQTHLAIPAAEARQLHQQYYRDYGLAIEGLVRHHQVEALDFNARVDDALPIEALLQPDGRLRRLLADLDRRRVRPWLLTNAHEGHARRVVGRLGVADQFDGLTFCDYGRVPLTCKPQRRMYEQAMRDAAVADPARCFFVDDSRINVVGALRAGWTAVQLLEPAVAPLDPALAPGPQLDPAAVVDTIASLEDLRLRFPEFFTSTS